MAEQGNQGRSTRTSRSGVNLSFFKGLRPIGITGVAIHEDIGVVFMVKCEGKDVPVYFTMGQGLTHFPQLLQEWSDKIAAGEMTLVINSPDM